MKRTSSCVTPSPRELEALFVCAFVAEMRKGELVQIQWSMVNLDAGFIHLPPRITKTREGRSVPILDRDMRHFFQ
jgi:integrase